MPDPWKNKGTNFWTRVLSFPRRKCNDAELYEILKSRRRLARIPSSCGEVEYPVYPGETFAGIRSHIANAPRKVSASSDIYLSALKTRRRRRRRRQRRCRVTLYDGTYRRYWKRWSLGFSLQDDDNDGDEEDDDMFRSPSNREDRSNVIYFSVITGNRTGSRVGWASDTWHAYSPSSASRLLEA